MWNEGGDSIKSELRKDEDVDEEDEEFVEEFKWNEDEDDEEDVELPLVFVLRHVVVLDGVNAGDDAFAISGSSLMPPLLLLLLLPVVVRSCISCMRICLRNEDGCV